MSDPIASALLQLGVTPTDISNVADADLSSVAVADYAKLLDLAELRTLENILSNYSKVDVKAGAVEAQLDDFGQRLERTIARKRAQMGARTAQAPFGYFP